VLSAVFAASSSVLTVYEYIQRLRCGSPVHEFQCLAMDDSHSPSPLRWRGGASAGKVGTAALFERRLTFRLSARRADAVRARRASSRPQLSAHSAFARAGRQKRLPAKYAFKFERIIPAPAVRDSWRASGDMRRDHHVVALQ